MLHLLLDDSGQHLMFSGCLLQLPNRMEQKQSVWLGLQRNWSQNQSTSFTESLFFNNRQLPDVTFFTGYIYSADKFTKFKMTNVSKGVICCKKFSTTENSKHKPSSAPCLSLITNSYLSPLKIPTLPHPYLNLCFAFAAFVLFIGAGKVLNLRNTTSPQFMPGVIWEVEVRKLLQQQWHQLLILSNGHWNRHRQIYVSGWLTKNKMPCSINSCLY